MYELNIERDYTFISKLYEKIGNYKLMRINILRQMQKSNNSSLTLRKDEIDKIIEDMERCYTEYNRLTAKLHKLFNELNLEKDSNKRREIESSINRITNIKQRIYQKYSEVLDLFESKSMRITK
ncbi:unknown [Clostridium sp. CAG:524]|nr:unknown [Clostridium sp. CAG:524]